MPDLRPIAVTRSRLLVVEDSPAMHAVLRTSLESMPRLELVGIATTATEAMAAFVAHQPDVVTIDLGLAEGSGLDVLRAIKLRAPRCQVLVFTGYDEEPFRARSLAAGADFFFSKNRQHQALLQHLHAFGGESAVECRPPASDRPGHFPECIRLPNAPGARAPADIGTNP